MGSGPLALVGSGEFLSNMVEVDAYVLGRLARERPRVAIVPTAAAEEGPASVDRWAEMGILHFQALGAEPVPVLIGDRSEANDPDRARALGEADLIYFSGYASDASTLLTDLPTSGQFAKLPVLGGDALYELGGYQSSSHAAGVRLRFTTFAYPDEWSILCHSGQAFACNAPAFFAIKFPKNFCGAFDFLCYIHALLMALVWTNPAS